MSKSNLESMLDTLISAFSASAEAVVEAAANDALYVHPTLDRLPEEVACPLPKNLRRRVKAKNFAVRFIDTDGQLKVQWFTRAGEAEVNAKAWGTADVFVNDICVSGYENGIRVRSYQP